MAPEPEHQQDHQRERRQFNAHMVVDITNCILQEAKAALYDAGGDDVDAAVTAILDDRAAAMVVANDTLVQSTSASPSIFTDFIDSFMIDRLVQSYFKKHNSKAPIDLFDPQWNKDFRSIKSKASKSGGGKSRGGSKYTPPFGCLRYALNVTNKYPPNDDWLGKDDQPGEWAVAFHGTKDTNVLGILKQGFLLSKGKQFAYGKGIYCTPDPKVALGYAQDYAFEDRSFKLILQCRVQPSKLQIVNKAIKYWLMPTEEAIRPYAICVYETGASIKQRQKGVRVTAPPPADENDEDEDEQPQTSKGKKRRHNE